MTQTRCTARAAMHTPSCVLTDAARNTCMQHACMAAHLPKDRFTRGPVAIQEVDIAFVLLLHLQCASGLQLRVPLVELVCIAQHCVLQRALVSVSLGGMRAVSLCLMSRGSRASVIHNLRRGGVLEVMHTRACLQRRSWCEATYVLRQRPIRAGRVDAVDQVQLFLTQNGSLLPNAGLRGTSQWGISMHPHLCVHHHDDMLASKAIQNAPAYHVIALGCGSSQVLGAMGAAAGRSWWRRCHR